MAQLLEHTFPFGPQHNQSEFRVLRWHTAVFMSSRFIVIFHNTNLEYPAWYLH